MHTGVIGGATFSTSTGLTLPTNYNFTTNKTNRTDFRISYPFKAGYTYTFEITANGNVSGGSAYPTLGGTLFTAAGLTYTSTSCGANNITTFPQIGLFLSTMTNTVTTYSPPSATFVSSNNYDYLVLESYCSSAQNITANVFIKQIKIKETPPISFTVAPSTLNVTTGTSVSQTYTVTNVYSTPGVTGYTWNLGATPNGWTYLGAAAPAIIATSAPTLALQTEVCATTIKSVSAIVNIGAATYNTSNSAVVTVSPPAYTITGPPRVCAGTTANYSINAPAGSTVNWVVSPAGIVTTPNPSTGLSTTLNKVADGTCTLTANVSTNGCASVPFNITLNTSSAGASSVITWTRSTLCNNGFQTWNLTADYTRGSNWMWSVGSLSGTNSQILIFNPTGSQTLADVRGYGSIKLNYTDVCGLATQDGVSVFTTCSPTFLVAPNPAQDNVTVTIDDVAQSQSLAKTTEVSANSIYKIRVTDRMGAVRKLLEYKTPIKSTKISINNLEAGIYSISIFDGTQWGTQELIIK